MREPAFWYRPSSWQARLLAPAAALYGRIAAQRMAADGERAGIPVICVGNYHVGGAGKTPTVIALAGLLRELGEVPVIVSRGYGGRLRGPVAVDAASHTAADVGDEPLMMASRLPVVVARDRAAGARFARRHGATVVLLDDGFQNPGLVKDVSLIVIDARRGVGNGGVFPAGPLRAPLLPQMARTDALVVVGNGTAADAVMAEIVDHGGLVFRAHLAPVEARLAPLRGRRVLAFAGIGDPQRFFATLEDNGVEVVEARAFADHHPYVAAEIDDLRAVAMRRALVMVTTEKDMARLATDPALATRIEDIATFPVVLGFADEDGLGQFLSRRLQAARAKK
jgi:tetraacyldisaccharide 4'-kinase